MRLLFGLLGALLTASLFAAPARAQVSLSCPPVLYNVYGPYSVYGPGLKRTPSSVDGSYSSLRAGGTFTSSSRGVRQARDAAAAPDPGPTSPVRGGPGSSHWRYVRIGVAGNVIQAIVIP
jgi:hypothetical protein